MGKNDFPFDIMDIAALLRLNIRRRGPGSVYADCPFCGDKRGKLNLNLAKNVWRCNYCSKGGGMLSLYAEVHGISNSEAYQEISETLLSNGAAITDSDMETPAVPQEEPQADRAPALEVHRTYSALLSMLTLTPPHWEHLRIARGLTPEQIERFGFRSTPQPYHCQPITETLMRQGYTVKGVPGFYLNDRGRWTMRFHQKTSGILIPIQGIDGRICGLQTRLDHPIRNEGDPPEKEGMKYLTLSTAGKRMGASSGSPVHFIGNPCSRVVYVTEGVLKADICHALTGRTFAATLGANNTSGLDALFAALRMNGTQEIIEAEDMDKYRNAAVNSGASKVFLLARQHELKCRRMTWNPNFKGFDDWQLALRRKQTETKEDRPSFKEQYLSGQCGIEEIKVCTDVWHQLNDCCVSLREYLGLTEPEYEVFLQSGLSSTFEAMLNSQRRRQCFRVYQLDLLNGKTIPYAFSGLDKLFALGYEQPRASDYALVHDGEIICPKGLTDADVLERIFRSYNDTLPETYHGRSISASDVIELYGDGERRYFYREETSFTPVEFSPLLAKNMK